MTSYSFKNGVTIDIAAANLQQEIQKWDDIKWMMSIFLDPPAYLPPEEPKPKKQYILSYKGYRARKLKDKARAKRKKK